MNTEINPSDVYKSLNGLYRPSMDIDRKNQWVAAQPLTLRIIQHQPRIR
jgi:hypothetical protein